MRLEISAAIAAFIAAAAWIGFPDRAAASHWGCEVLLCASSSNPSWQDVKACHPPMNRLISAMRRPGFSWPTCPEAGTGRPGYEAYGDCPAGWTIGHSSHKRGRDQSDLCVQTRNNCPSGIRRQDDCLETDTIPRPPRADPYFFDIRHKDGAVTRHWFSLRR